MVRGPRVTQSMLSKGPVRPLISASGNEFSPYGFPYIFIWLPHQPETIGLPHPGLALQNTKIFSMLIASGISWQ